jgi:hypothetical protein
MKTRLGWVLVLALVSVASLLTLSQNDPGNHGPVSATYKDGTLRVSIPSNLTRDGVGNLKIEVLDPEDRVVGSLDRHLTVRMGQASWKENLALTSTLAIDELVWHRLRYQFTYDNEEAPALSGIDSISAVLRRPVVHVLGQQAYLSGGAAAVRLIASDSSGEVITGSGSVRIELLAPKQRTLLYTARLNRRGTTRAQFRFPSGLVGNYSLRYAVDTEIGSAEYTQDIRLDDKVSILLSTEKPIYQPSQTIHMRALALDRATHEAVGARKLTFELEDSRGNKVFKKFTETDGYGIASAEFSLADEVNLGTYHLRALMDDSNKTETALQVERYVLPKFKVAVDFAGRDAKTKRGYRPGDHVTGTVRANYFFGKPVDGAEVAVKASALDVSVFDAGSSKGKTDSDGAFRFDILLPNYFAGRPLSQGAARVLIEATVKDHAGHNESRGEPVTVSESPLLITAVPESGVMVPHLDNQVFILTSYPDGTPAQTDVQVAGQTISTDKGGVAIVSVPGGTGSTTLQIEARDREGNHTSRSVLLQSRSGSDQILLRADRAVYRTGERIHLQVFSTKSSGSAYVDVIKDGQTVGTHDLDIVNGHAELAFAATPELAGTVEFNGYLFGGNAIAAADHRLAFVQPADELKIETALDAPAYKPGGEARIAFRVTNSRGEGVQAALGLQIVDQAVFALAEKQPGFAKVFFYLEQEMMKPRYEIHSIGLPEVIEEGMESSQHDRAARALFAATETVRTNKSEWEFGRTVPQTRFPEYAARYTRRLQAQVDGLATNSEICNPAIATFKSGTRAANLVDAWGTTVRIESSGWSRGAGYYQIRSAGPDRQFNTSDDLVANIQNSGCVTAGLQGQGRIDLQLEHERGPFNGLAEIAGSVKDQSGAAIPRAMIKLLEIDADKVQTAAAKADGTFTFSGVRAGRAEVQVFAPGFATAARQFSLAVRDRAVLSVVLNVGMVTETVEVTAAAGAVFRTVQDLPMNGRAVAAQAGAMAFSVVSMEPGVTPAAKSVASRQEPDTHVRSWFPEALYIAPEIITDRDGRASITIPIADSITTWRMAMLASTTKGALGSGTSSLKVFQDFFVDLDLPVTLTQGDHVSIPVAVYNYSGSRGDVRLQLQQESWFSSEGETLDRTLPVDSGRVGGSQFTIEAARIGKFKLTLKAGMDGSAKRADIVVREIEVVPNGREQSMVFNGRLDATIQHQLDFPAASIRDASTIFVRLYPGPLSQVIEGMDSLLRMPYGCFEQTSSSTYPNVLALDYMKRTKKLTPEVHAKAEGFIANGYQRLLTFEVPGGGFSWFGNAPANKILTSYGLMEFSDMSKVHDTDPKVIQRTQQWLAGQQQPDGSWKPDTNFINEGATNRYNADVLRITAYIAWSLETTGYQGPAVEKAKQFIESHLSADSRKPDAYTLAVLANFAADYAKDRTFTSRTMQLLLDARTEQDDKVWWKARCYKRPDWRCRLSSSGAALLPSWAKR